jgi:hypothetical protein
LIRQSFRVGQATEVDEMPGKLNKQAKEGHENQDAHF